MDFRQFDGSHLWKLEKCIKLLPNIKPRKARAKLSDWQSDLHNQIINDSFNGIEKESYEVKVSNSFTLTSSDFEHIFFGDGYSATLVTPHGAELICAAYQQGLFELNGKKDISIIPIELIEYCSSSENILAAQEHEKIEYENKKKAYQESLTKLDEFTESQFSYELLNDIFVEAFGYKGSQHILVIGGVNVKKSVSLYKSNSGKSSDWEVSFNWIDAAGESKVLKKDSIYSENRRNYADRNYGLHE